MVLVALLGCTDPPSPPVPTAHTAPTPVATPDLGSSPVTPPTGHPPDAAAGTTGDAMEPGTSGSTGEPEIDPLDGEVRPGDSLSKILHRAGLGAAEIQRVAEALGPVMDPATIRVGQHYVVELDEGGELSTFSFRRTQTDVAVVERQDDGRLVGRLDVRKTELREEQIGGEVDSSLSAALTDRGHSAALVDVLTDVFAYDINFFTATRKGDRFQLVVERHELDGELVRYGRVLAARYQGEAAGTVEVLWWVPPGGGDGRYVDAEGKGVSRTLLKSPLKFARVSSGFNPKRMHPVLHRVKSHQGVDYAAAEGTPVWAAADGKIVFRADKGGAGNMVILRHPGGLKTLYMHLSKFAEGQRVGDQVKAKTVIGYVGMTGLATGPHLHFGVQLRGRYVDPSTLESVRGPGVAKRDRKKFLRARARWSERLSSEADGDARGTDSGTGGTAGTGSDSGSSSG